MGQTHVLVLILSLLRTLIDILNNIYQIPVIIIRVIVLPLLIFV